jgi:protein-disulfide isomerase
MPRMSEATQEVPARPLPRRGRVWIMLLLGLFLLALGYLVVTLSTREAGSDAVRIHGIGETQEIFGGVPQEGDRFGSADAPVTVQLFNDVQCSSCREDFLTAMPTLAEKYARPGDVKFLYRHYSNSESPIQLGFVGAEAAAALGYGWQYTYLFFRNQEEAERFGVNEDFLDDVAGATGEMDYAEWRDYLDKQSGPDGAITRNLEADEELGRGLGIRYGQAAIVSGPNGARTIQDGATLGQIERAIAAVE